MTRISVSHEVTAAIGPLVNTRYQLHTIVEGHDVDYFSNRPPAAPSTSAPIRVLYTTWKSNLGDRIQEQFPHGENSRSVAWIAVREPLGWPALRNRYHGADIFVCAPGPEEGFYLPGLEAMAAGAAVVTAIVGGNAAYARDGQNAIVADYDDVGSHIDALQMLIGDAELRAAVVNGGRATTEAHRLDRERSEFADVLATVGP